MRYLYCFTVILSLFSCNPTSVNNTLKDPKNIVVIIADDHALKVSGFGGNEIVRTPSMDKLADESVTFTSAYCNAPICSASRQSLLTGKYPYASGVNLLFTPFPDEGNTTIAEHLKKYNYQTAIVGKTHWNNWVWASLYKDEMPDHGFDVIIDNNQYKEFLELNPPLPLPDSLNFYSRKGVSPENSTADWMNWRSLPHPVNDAHSKGTFLANQAVEFIKKNQKKPFFVWLAFNEPHHPYYFPWEYANRYNPEEMPMPEGSPEDDRWIPERFKNLTDEEKRGIIAAYYTSTEYMDKNIGIVTNALDEMKLSDNTIVMYLSDNGYLLNEHKRFEKHTMWEEATHQPLIVKAGNKRAGEQETAIVEYIDVVPTLLELAGIPELQEVQGKSFAPVIREERNDHREFALSTYLQDNLAMVFDGKWKYVFTTGKMDLTIGYATGNGPSGIVHRLYNLEADPNEYINVAANYPEKLLELQEKMLQRFMETHPDAANCPKQLTLEGKLVWFCEPRDIGYDQYLEDIPLRVFTE